MKTFEWNDALLTKNYRIDADHKKIIQKAQELNEDMAQGKGKEHIIETVKFLESYVKKHFAEEEKMQASSGYPDLELHKEQHRYFENEISELSTSIQANPESSVNVLKLNKLMSGWFFNHIQRLDVEVAKHVKDE